MTVDTEQGSIEPEWTFGDRVRKARGIADMNQREFADAIGVKEGSLAAWETDRSTPRDIVSVAKQIESVTNIPTSWLLGIDGGPPPPRPPAQPFHKPQAVRVPRRLRSIADVAEDRRSDELVEVREDRWSWYARAIAGDVDPATGKPVGKSSDDPDAAVFVLPARLAKAS